MLTMTNNDRNRSRSLPCLKQRTQRLDLALEPGAPNLEIVALGLDILELRLESAHLIDPLLTIATRSHGVGFALLDLRSLRSEGIDF